jgi:hypothetical protein
VQNHVAPVSRQEPEVNLANVGEPALRPEVDSRGWRQLGRALVPSRLFSRRTKWYSRLWEVVKFPYFLAFTLTIPIAESDDVTDDVTGSDEGDAAASASADKSWSQYLHVIQVTVYVNCHKSA